MAGDTFDATTAAEGELPSGPLETNVDGPAGKGSTCDGDGVGVTAGSDEYVIELEEASAGDSGVDGATWETCIDCEEVGTESGPSIIVVVKTLTASADEPLL